ncbi:MAG: DUF4956 domain-containing protein [Pseudomonadota bacterium]
MEKIFDIKLLTTTGVQQMADVGLLPFFLIMVTSLVASLFISHIYLRFYGSKGTGSTLHRAFPLLGVAITAIFVCLQFSIPLSLGLLGALSIVRFRTPIKDPEEVGFILLVIATSITCATFNLPFLLIILTVAIIGLVILRKDQKLFRKNGQEGMLITKVPLAVYNKDGQQLLSVLKSNIKGAKIDSVTESDTDCTISYVFTSFDEGDLANIKESVLKIDESVKVNLFFNHNSI